MKLSHIALWVNDLERMKAFYALYFSALFGNNYHNPLKNFESSFLHFESGASIELMQKTNQQLSPCTEELTVGLHHLAFSVGSKENVDQLTIQLKADGYAVLSQPRITGDGYYESVITDPEGNLVEITE